MFCTKCQEEISDCAPLKHLRDFHLGEKDLQLSCPYPGCGQVIQTVPFFQKHWYEKHHVSKKRQLPLSSSQPTCSGISVSQVQEFQVVSEVESEVAKAKKACPEGIAFASKVQCAVSNKSLEISDEPGDADVEMPQSVCMPGKSGSDVVSDDLSSDVVQVSDSEYSTDSEKSEEEEKEYPEPLSKPNLQSQTIIQSPAVNLDAASFLLTLKEKCHVPSTHLKEVLNATECLIKSSVRDFSLSVDEKLKKKNLSLSDILDVEKGVNASSQVFNNLKTDYQQKKYFQKALGIIEPQRITLGREFRRVRRKNSSSVKTVVTAEELIYVPVTDVVEKLINHPDYKHFVEDGCIGRSNSHFLDSYMKGDKCKENPVLREHPDALRFVLYYDDLEVCSPLKSKATKQKIGAFYLYLDNIPLKYRSNLNVICLVALVNANYIKDKKYGMDAALEQVVKDLRKFEDGYILKNGKKVFGTLIATIGDNLGLHAIGGFKEGFTAHRCCRFCYATYSEVQKMTVEDIDILRNVITHNLQCAQVQTARGKNETLSTEYGINRSSFLNTLKSYHVVGGLPPDIMHDILEGALSITIKRLLRYLLFECKEKKFTLDWLNKAIRDFDFDYAELCDKPSELKKETITSEDSTSLHQSASQLWLLATILPLIIGPLIDVNDKHYQNFLDMLEITRIVFSTEISKWMVVYLKDLIEVYLSDFISLYGSLIPKQHHLLHYPSQILLFGSLVNYMCMRCEAKHKYFKKIVYMIGNYKNISLSLGTRHQMSQAVAWNKSLMKTTEYGPCVTVKVKDSAFSSLLPHISETVVQTNWLEYNGLKYVPERCFVCVDFVDAMPVFVKVVKLLISPEILLICQKVTTTKHNPYLASYEIDTLPDFCICRPDQMKLRSVLHAHKINGRQYIAVKYCAGDCLL